MSYRRAWQLVDALNNSFKEPVVITAIGGKRGGGTVVTELGKQLVAQFRAMESKSSAVIADDIRLFSASLRHPRSERK